MTAKYSSNGSLLYTTDEDQFLIDHFSSMSVRSMANQLQRTMESVRSRIVKLRRDKRIDGVAFRSSTRSIPITQPDCKRTPGAIQAEHAAVADEVRLFLTRQVQSGLMTAESAVAMAVRLRRHLDTKGSAKLINLSVLRIVELLQTNGETP